MVDLILTSVKRISSSIWSNMADLTEKIDDLICSFESGGDFTMDTVAMLIFGWAVLGVVVLALTKYVYGRFFAKKAPVSNEPILSKKVASGTESSGVSSTTTTTSATHKEQSKEMSKDKSDGLSLYSKTSSAKTGGKFVPPTPPLRKRLSTKKGSALIPAVSRTPTQIPSLSITGPDFECVQWVNELYMWIYSNSDIANEILNVWLQTLNDYMKNSTDENGVGVEVVRILPETHPPNLTNVFCECGTNDDITITCDCEATPALQLKAFRQKEEKVEVSHYRLNVNRFRARLNIGFITEKLLAEVKCDGWPDIKVALAPVGSIKNNTDEQFQQDVIADTFVTAMRNSVVPLNLNQYPSCPRFSRFKHSNNNNNNNNNNASPDFQDDSLNKMLLEFSDNANSLNENTGRRRQLVITGIQAMNLSEDCRNSYCILEMDEPPQKYISSTQKNTSEPVWDEQFIFNVKPGKGELLFEIYENTSKKLLGMGIVGTEELMSNHTRRQMIPLQSQPFESDRITGSIAVEVFYTPHDFIITSVSAFSPTRETRFMVVEDNTNKNSNDVTPHKYKEVIKSVTPGGNVITTSKTVFTASEGQLANGVEAVTDSALKELESREKTNSGTKSPTSKSTLIIHSVSRVEQSRNGLWREVVGTGEPQGTLDGSVPNESKNEKSEPAEDEGNDDDDDNYYTLMRKRFHQKRRRDFFGTIKRKLTMSRARSKSVDPGERVEVDPLTRSVSADRMRESTPHSRGTSLRVGDGEISRRSSLSDTSGLSGASARTYLNEASTLVLETVENGFKKHYLVPLSLAKRNKWKKKGTKLHIYNDHTFIAKHFYGTVVCQVCSSNIPRRFGKQGYECRDCLLKCHKACHVKADQSCPDSGIHNIEL
ncbi:conserved hypothetical protein [Pediculus humanus corporis]|uniref:Uncharacterized protein n=1 Tax=Pediculus humanus subsp. corporis TaxID=121224 RepID=E0VR85_PEDHC|nr:uncharacterized protein Phum_PHUM394590 [Pediculus humanus corporis]EEB15891.1 conserved hypothetical protein [Pediculus humanus corporis]